MGRQDTPSASEGQYDPERTTAALPALAGPARRKDCHPSPLTGYIHRYSRSDAIRDGVLIDVSTVASEAGIRYPVVQAEEAFARAERAGYEGVAFDHHAHSDDGHGRQEERSVAVLYDAEALPEGWPDAKAVVSVVRRRTAGGVSTTTSHYYVSSHAGTAQEMAELIRGHWGGTTPTKRLKAGWDDEFLLQVLQGIPAIIVR